MKMPILTAGRSLFFAVSCCGILGCNNPTTPNKVEPGHKVRFEIGTIGDGLVCDGLTKNPMWFCKSISVTPKRIPPTSQKPEVLWTVSGLSSYYSGDGRTDGSAIFTNAITGTVTLHSSAPGEQSRIDRRLSYNKENIGGMRPEAQRIWVELIVDDNRDVVGQTLNADVEVEVVYATTSGESNTRQFRRSMLENRGYAPINQVELTLKTAVLKGNVTMAVLNETQLAEKRLRQFRIKIGFVAVLLLTLVAAFILGSRDPEAKKIKPKSVCRFTVASIRIGMLKLFKPVGDVAEILLGFAAWVGWVLIIALIMRSC